MNYGSLSTLEQRRLLTLHGPNFSGRTHLLRFMTGLEPDMEQRYSGGRNGRAEPQPSVYLGPEVQNAISGLAPTVREELNLHLHGTKYRETITQLVEELGITALGNRNPATLSGGEQALLTLLCAFGLTPRNLAIDCALEQVSADFRSRIMGLIREGTFDYTAVAFTDNRLAACDEIQDSVPIPEGFGMPLHKRLLPIDSLNPEIDLPLESGQCAPLALDHLNFQYPQGPYAIRDLSLMLEPGRLYTVVGENGAGKSTLAKLLCGVLRPDAGHILLDEDLYDPWTRPGHMIGYHFQNPDLQLFTNRIDKEIASGPRAQNLDERLIRQRREAVMAAFGLSRIGTEHPLDLPFVIRKRVALAATLAMARPWVILDEPTLGQDDDAVQALTRIIEQMLAKGLGVIVISHSGWFGSQLPGTVIELHKEA